MPQIQPYPPTCPRCRKLMKLALIEKSDARQFCCADCDQPDPMHNSNAQGWLKGELGSHVK